MLKELKSQALASKVNDNFAFLEFTAVAAQELGSAKARQLNDNAASNKTTNDFCDHASEVTPKQNKSSSTRRSKGGQKQGEASYQQDINKEQEHMQMQQRSLPQLQSMPQPTK